MDNSKANIIVFFTLLGSVAYMFYIYRCDKRDRELHELQKDFLSYQKEKKFDLKIVKNEEKEEKDPS